MASSASKSPNPLWRLDLAQVDIADFNAVALNYWDVRIGSTGD